MKKLFLLIFTFLSFTLLVSAQTDTLPKFKAIKKNGEISISWINSFKNVSQVNIQRSKDSTRNFSTIHSLSNPNVKNYSYVDKTAKNDSGYYRIFVLFEGSNYIFTPSKRLFIDTTKIVEPTPKINAVIEKEFDLLSTYICELDFDALLYERKIAKEYSKFPSTSRDLSLMTPASMLYGELEQYIKSIAPKELVKFSAIDRYIHESFGENVSLTLKLQFQSNEKTLEEEDITSAIELILSNLKTQFGVVIR